jgi:hypothetical protein
MTGVQITERGYRDSCLGRVLQLKVFTADYRPLGWREVWDAFAASYPGRWAVQVFPPAGALVDGKAVYHLWLLPGEPEGLNLRA